MMKTGWWNVDFTITLDGEEVDFSELSEMSQEQILKLVSEGYESGVVVEEFDMPDYNGQVIFCPDCGAEITIEFDTARCEECDWMCADAELDDLMEE